MIRRRVHFSCEDLDVISRVCGRGEEGEKLRDESRAADLVELIAVAQHLRQRDEIDRLGRVPQLQQDREYGACAGM